MTATDAKMSGISQSAAKSFAYILGVYLGDGCVTRRPGTTKGQLCFKLNTIDAEFAETTKLALEQLTDCKVSIWKHDVKKSAKPNHTLHCPCDDLCRWLKNDTSSKQIIPGYVERWSLEMRQAFITGLMDSEGFVAAQKSYPTNRGFYMGYKSCDPWVPQLVRIMEKSGLRIGKLSEEAPRKEGYKTPRRFHIKMQSWVNSGIKFSIRRKQERVDEWASVGPYEKRALYPRRLRSETNTSSTRKGDDRVRPMPRGVEGQL